MRFEFECAGCGIWTQKNRCPSDVKRKGPPRFCGHRCEARSRRSKSTVPRGPATVRELIGKLIIQPDGCCIWPGSGSDYVRINIGRQKLLLHRFLYETLISPLSKQYDLHHTCANKRCSNFAHLEPRLRQDHSRQHSFLRLTEANLSFLVRLSEAGRCNSRSLSRHTGAPVSALLRRFCELGLINRRIHREFAASGRRSYTYELSLQGHALLSRREVGLLS